MKKIVVTGATGMIAIALIREAVRQNTEVIALYRKESERANRIPEHPLVHPVACDLKEMAALPAPRDDCDVFYHFGWADNDKAGRMDASKQTANIQYTYDAVQLARRCGCKTFIGAGSQAEYARHQGPIRSDTPTNPITPYGAAKNAAASLSRELCTRLGMTHIWVRIFSVYGTNDGENTMVSTAIRRFKNREKVLFSAGRHKWDYLFEEDAGKLFYAVGEKVDFHAEFNAAYGASLPLRDYVELIAFLMDAEDLAEFETEEKEDALSLEADIRDLVAATGWRPETSFLSGIRKMIGETR